MESKNNWKAWLYLAPVLILMTVFTLYPIINTVGISFLKNYDALNGGENDGFTFDNYLELLHIKEMGQAGSGYYRDEFLFEALPNTLLITLITVPLSIILSLIIAIALNSIKAFKKIYQTIFFMPYVTNAIAVGMVFSVIFDNNGLFNWIFGLTKTWLYAGTSGQNPTYPAALFALCFYIIWHAMPYKILILLSGLQGIDQQYYDAAKVDGANKLKTIWKVTIPLLSPQILYIMITSFISGFKEYTSVVALFPDGGHFLEGTGPATMQTVAFYIYDQMNSEIPHLQFAAAGAVILLVIILAVTALQKYVSKRRVHY